MKPTTFHSQAECFNHQATAEIKQRPILKSSTLPAVQQGSAMLGQSWIIEFYSVYHYFQ